MALPREADTKLTLESALERLRASPFDETAWRTLYHELWPYVVLVVGGVVGRYDESVQDIAQEAFLRLLSAGPTTDFASPQALRAYLRMIALNEARSFLRRERRSVFVPASERALAESASSVGASDDAVRESEALVSLMVNLDPEEQRLLSYIMDGYPIADVAQALQITYSAAGVKIHRLRRRVAKLLEEADLTLARKIDE